ncbi:MAG: hypothetical protein LBV37_00735 [Mycoplasmataceae bacterium]|jgi:hypothetical protein|nr:hypothetical protein [Mycoplasmataceae bacterium]
MAATYKIMNITKDKQLIGQDITLTKANSKTVKNKYVLYSEFELLRNKVNRMDTKLNKIIKKLGA